MELLYEISPVRSREELLARVRALRELVDWVDVPDSPMGRPSQSSPVVSCLIKSLEGVGVIAHVRTVDLSRIALVSTVRSLAVCGVERLVFVRGDVVRGSSVVKDVEPEEAVNLVRELNLGVSPGLTLSLRKDVAEISGRVRGSRADFYLVLNLSRETADKLEEVSRTVRSANARLYPYLVVAKGEGYEALERLLGEGRVLTEKGALEIAADCAHLVDGFLVSSPLDFEGGLSFLKRLRGIV